MVNPVSFCGVQWAKLGQKKLRAALPPPLPFVLTGDGCKDISLTPSKKAPLDRPVPLLFLAYPESSLLRTCIPDRRGVPDPDAGYATVCIHRF